MYIEYPNKLLYLAKIFYPIYYLSRIAVFPIFYEKLFLINKSNYFIYEL